jgi:aspartyl-tRNA(Asn)/glutamyl-tRNA(Gln) amidotransferase subunit C
MPALTRKEVEEIALLARLHLESDEIERMQTELGAIIDYFSTIAVVDTDGVAPMTHAVPTNMTLRADEPGPSLSVEEALRGAPKRDGDLIVVPAIIPGAES